MSYWIAGAMVVSAIGGAVSSNNAAKKNAEGTKKGLDQSMTVTNKARADVISLFDSSAKKAGIGTGAALDFYKQNALKRMQPAVQGNMMAQQAVGQGGIQANNAILGLPVDMSFANNPQQVPADYSGIMGAQLPQQAKSFADQEAERIAAEQPGIDAANAAAKKAADEAAAAKKKSYYDGSTGGITMAAFDRDRLDAKQVLGNPLGLNKNLNEKLKPDKKLKKIFGF